MWGAEKRGSEVERAERRVGPRKAETLEVLFSHRALFK